MIVEVGTSDFRTKAGKEEGLFIEPVKVYFDRLPECNKVNCAISNYTGEIDIYYVDPEDIPKHQLPNWVRGCNSVGKPHPTVVNLLNKEQQNLINKDTVKVRRLHDVLQDHNIEQIDLLKIDTEGHDHIILNDYLDNTESLPGVIQFENNVLSDNNEVTKLVKRLQKLGYKCQQLRFDMICKR